MRLTKIKLAGFKSFVDPTDIPITHDLIGIVGPNGCGKSNIIDAVRWVLGESKASALRGESMQDVIFNGTTHRKPVGRASVELLFDNSLGKTTGSWSSYAEIAIKRIVQRDGHSNYYINNIHVRRRDVADLFLGTGVGGRGYAIIEQGMISRIIEAKPQDLKSFLEEAAGISKYRERRHETELRLADTHKNLVRIEDISSELKKQIEHLENQAKTAIKYNSLNQQLQEAQQILWLKHRMKAANERIAAEKEIKTLEQALETEIHQIQLNKEQREKERIHEQNCGEELHDLEGQLYSLKAEKSRIEQEIHQFHKNSQQLDHQIQDFEKQLTRNRQLHSTATHNLQHWSSEKENAQHLCQSIIDKTQAEKEKLPELEKELNRYQQLFDTEQEKLIAIERADSLAKAHIEHANKTIQQLASRKDRLQREHDSLATTCSAKLKEVERELEQTKQQFIQTEQSLHQTESAFKQKSSEKDSVTSKIHELQKALSHLQAQFNALENLQQRIETNDALKQWINKQNLGETPRLWHHIHIEKDWENALESILQERLNSLGFLTLETIAAWKDDLPPGKLSILEFQQEQSLTDNNRSTKFREWKTLAECVTCDHHGIKHILAEWLKNIYIIEHIQDGLQQRKLLALDEQLITREGHIVTRNSVHFHSPDSHLHGVLSRQRELNLIQTKIQTLEAQQVDKQAILAEITTNYEKLHQTVLSNRDNLQQLTQRQHQLQLEKTKLSQIDEQTKQRKNLIAAELEEINQQLLSENQQKTHTEKQSENQASQIEVLNAQVHANRAKLDSAKQHLKDQHQKIQDYNKEIQEAIFNEKICQNKINDIENSLVQLEEDSTHLSTKRDNTVIEKNKLNDATLNSQLLDCIEHHNKLEQNVTDSREQLEATRHQVQTIENQLMESEQKQSSIRELLNKLYLKRQESDLQEKRYAEQLYEKQADENKLISQIDNKSTTDVQAEINTLTKKITAMGTVNLAAIDELDASRQRERKLDVQIQDLREAMALLENAIEQIDQETRKRLQETFQTVNRNLNEIFPIVFSGGKAELVFCDGKILESGIILTAQPPGKKNNSIHLLSGGEKALTALSLIFALFRLKPAPFCLLDEVDAPLDDTNTVRFCELVKKLSQQIQFLFISHNKITMEIAQQLIGITMQDQGISKVVAVDIASVVNPDEQKNIAFS